MIETVGTKVDPAPGHRRPNLGFFLILIVSFAILLALGTWQVQRLEWKQGLINTIEQRVQQAPVELDFALERWLETGDVEYYPVKLGGVLRHENEQHFLATYNGQSGWYVYTPLLLADGRQVIVNRGFVPYDMKIRSARPWNAVEGRIEVEGLARNPLAEKPGWMVPDNSPSDRTWYWKDFDAMAATMQVDKGQLVPFFVDISLKGAREIDGPVAGVTRISLPNRHLQYAVTWFGLAGALAVVGGFVVWRGMRKPNL